MGREIQRVLMEATDEFRLVGGSARKFEGEPFYQGRLVTVEMLGKALSHDHVDVVFDFSTPEANQLLLAALQQAGVHGARVLIGTTGLAPQLLVEWRKVARDLDLTVLVAPNTSVGVLLTLKAALVAALPLSRMGFDIEITETHHRAKKDAPSGTARFLADALAREVHGSRVVAHRSGARQAGEIGVHAVRGGGVVGEHEIRLIGDNEEVAIRHRAFSRALFATGAVVLARWVLRQDPGVYELIDVEPEALGRLP
jgi:4-hydroxy-tetrahydrodipicolinate reductase